MVRLPLPLVVLLACCSASGGDEPECDADCPAQYQPAIPAADLELGKRIGAGTEKVIYAGRWRGIDVAAMEILGHSKARDIALQRRIAQHPTLGAHSALVRVLGETDDGRFILNELAPLGSLTNYDGSAAVLTRPDIGGRATTAVLLEAASQILEADMALFDAGLLHRDLAARNVLAYNFPPDDPAGVIVKLTDFGLTIPIGGDPAWPPGHAMGTRWMAPEAQPTAAFEFGEASEVYAWGCLLYELFARGRVPYAGMGNNAIPRAKQRGGPAPGPQPRGCPTAVYELMQLCWEFFPANRPSLKELRTMMNELQQSNATRLRAPPAAATTAGAVVAAAEDGPWVPLKPEHINELEEEFALSPRLLPALRRYREQQGDSNATTTTAAAAVLLAGTVGEVEHRGLTGSRIVRFPLLSAEFCAELMAELSAFHSSGRTTARANSNNRHSLRVVELGWAGFLEPLVVEVADPIARALGLIPPSDPSTAAADKRRRRLRLRFSHAHTVQRVHADDPRGSPLPGSNRGSRHTDSSAVTLNIQIGGDWEGGALLFGQPGGAPDAVVGQDPAQRGWAVMHRGSDVHQADLITAGHRINLVVWANEEVEEEE